MLLIGSKALEHYIPDLGRVTHDWDILCSDDDFESFCKEFKSCIVKTTNSATLFEINNVIYEIKNTAKFDPSDFSLFAYPTVSTKLTPFGTVSIPQLRILHAIKKATAEVLDEPKHKYDLELIENCGIEFRENTPLYQQRLKETIQRVEKSKAVKKEFFHKYKIPEYIYHDNLHDVIGDLLDLTIPTYRRITTADTDIAEEYFNKLTHAQKISLMVEESLVLALERWFIPQMVENGINYTLIDTFYNNNEGLPTYKILKHCNIVGLKGEASYITNFARTNFFEIEKEWIAAKIKIKEKGGFPKSFFKEIFSIRDAYKRGEKVDKGL